MRNYRPLSVEQFSENPFSLIGNEWMLVSAAKKDGKINCMTASWGGFGVLWHKNVCFVFIRPSRYTYEFAEEAESISLSFFGKNYRSQLSLCGTKSGRDMDKIKECGFHVSLEDGVPVYEEARLTIKAKKLYAAPFDAKYFIDKSCIDEPNNLHQMYVCEIEAIEEK